MAYFKFTHKCVYALLSSDLETYFLSHMDVSNKLGFLAKENRLFHSQFIIVFVLFKVNMFLLSAAVANTHFL